LTNPTFLELDLASGEGVQLLRALASRHGHALAEFAQYMRRLFLLRSPCAPGLSFVGGEAEPLRLPRALAYPGLLSVAGSGEILEQALASCLGEGVERLSQIQQPNDVIRECSYDDAAPCVMPAARDSIERLLGASAGCRPNPIAWIRGRPLAAHGELLLPADWCLRRQPKGALAVAGAALSTGCAAGPSFEVAALRAVLELIERDAASLWWIGGRRPRPVAADSAAMAEAVRLFGTLRQGNRDRPSWLLDITTDLGVPCVVAVSTNASGRGLACGLAARLSLQQAAGAAVFELCQMELAIEVVAAKRRERGDGALNDIDRRHLARAGEIDAAECELIHPLGAPARDPERTAGDPESELAILQAAFARLQIEVALVDLTRAEIGIPVVCAVAPELQLMPGEANTKRLRREIAATGGGARWTKGVALM